MTRPGMWLAAVGGIGHHGKSASNAALNVYAVRSALRRRRARADAHLNSPSPSRAASCGKPPRLGWYSLSVSSHCSSCSWAMARNR